MNKSSLKIEKIMPVLSEPGHRLRVAAYCLSQQICSLRRVPSADSGSIITIASPPTPNWELVYIYWESGVNGTRTDKRTELAHLLADCERGRIDLILTKSISRSH